MSYKGFSSFSSGGQFVHLGGTILALLVLGHKTNIFFFFFFFFFFFL